MNRNSKYPIIMLALLTLIVGGYRYYQYVVEGNFLLEVNMACDPQHEACFSPSADSGIGSGPYKKVEINAHYAPKCLEEHNCENFSCQNIPAGKCTMIHCSDSTRTEGEECLLANV